MIKSSFCMYLSMYKRSFCIKDLLCMFSLLYAILTGAGKAQLRFIDIARIENAMKKLFASADF